MYAKVITFVYGCIFGLILVFMNIIYAVKCYISKSKVLDPPMPWGDDDVLGIRLIRCSGTVLITGFFTVMYTLGMYPKIYYSLVDQNVSLTNSPEGGYIFLGLTFFLVLTGTVIGIITKVIEAASGHILEVIVPRQMNFFLWIFPTVIIVVYLPVRIFEPVHPFEGMFIVCSIWFIIIPALVIYFADQIKHNVSKVLKNKIEEAFMLSIYVTPAIITVILYCTLYTIYTLFDI
jgi:hypothetical protein